MDGPPEPVPPVTSSCTLHSVGSRVRASWEIYGRFLTLPSNSQTEFFSILLERGFAELVAELAFSRPFRHAII